VANQKKHVFVSYSTKDLEVCEKIRDAIEAQKIKCWMAPRDIPAGSIYASSIIDAIAHAQVFLLILGPHSNTSSQVQKEIDRAVNAKIPIVVFRLEDVVLSKALEYYLCDTHWVEGHSGHFTSALKSLPESLKKLWDMAASEEDIPPLPPLPNLEQGRKGKSLRTWPLFLILLAALAAGSYYWLGQKTNLKSPKASAHKITQKPFPNLQLALSSKDLEGYSFDDLTLMKREIEARAGTIFEEPEIKNYFEHFDWYRPAAVVVSIEETNQKIEDKMSIIQITNIELLESKRRFVKFRELLDSKLPDDLAQKEVVALVPFYVSDSNFQSVTDEQGEKWYTSVDFGEELEEVLLLDNGIKFKSLVESTHVVYSTQGIKSQLAAYPFSHVIGLNVGGAGQGRVIELFVAKGSPRAMEFGKKLMALLAFEPLSGFKLKGPFEKRPPDFASSLPYIELRIGNIKSQRDYPYICDDSCYETLTEKIEEKFIDALTPDEAEDEESNDGALDT